MKTKVTKIPLDDMLNALQRLRDNGYTHFNIDVSKDRHNNNIVDIYAYIQEDNKIETEKSPRKLTLEYLRSIVTYG